MNFFFHFYTHWRNILKVNVVKWSEYLNGWQLRDTRTVNFFLPFVFVEYLKTLFNAPFLGNWIIKENVSLFFFLSRIFFLSFNLFALPRQEKNIYFNPITFPCFADVFDDIYFKKTSLELSKRNCFDFIWPFLIIHLFF